MCVCVKLLKKIRKWRRRKGGSKKGGGVERGKLRRRKGESEFNPIMHRGREGGLD